MVLKTVVNAGVGSVWVRKGGLRKSSKYDAILKITSKRLNPTTTSTTRQDSPNHPNCTQTVEMRTDSR